MNHELLRHGFRVHLKVFQGFILPQAICSLPLSLLRTDRRQCGALALGGALGESNRVGLVIVLHLQPLRLSRGDPLDRSGGRLGPLALSGAGRLLALRSNLSFSKAARVEKLSDVLTDEERKREDERCILAVVRELGFVVLRIVAFGRDDHAAFALGKHPEERLCIE